MLDPIQQNFEILAPVEHPPFRMALEEVWVDGDQGEPRPVPVPVTDLVRVPEQNTRWEFRAPPTEVVVGGLIVAGVVVGVALLFTPAAPVGVAVIAVSLVVGIFYSDNSMA